MDCVLAVLASQRRIVFDSLTAHVTELSLQVSGVRPAVWHRILPKSKSERERKVDVSERLYQF